MGVWRLGAIFVIVYCLFVSQFPCGFHFQFCARVPRTCSLHAIGMPFVDCIEHCAC